MQEIKGELHWERGDFLYLIKNLSKDDARKRHEIRYALFRIVTELEGGNKAEDIHWEISDMIQTIKGAGEPASFADVWDVGRVSPEITIVNRLWSVHEEHDQMVKRVTVTLEKHDTPESLARKEQVAQDREARRVKRELNKAEAQSDGV